MKFRERAPLTKDQSPFATILGCSDSRVPVEIIFDQGFGNLFVIRVAGNIIGDDEVGSVEFAVDHLNTPLLLVLGHEKCGAVSAALKPLQEREKEWPGIRKLLTHIYPALENIDPLLPMDQKIDLAVEANVRWSIQQLSEIPELQEKITEGNLVIAGGLYEMETGKVRVLS